MTWTEPEKYDYLLMRGHSDKMLEKSLKLITFLELE